MPVMDNTRPAARWLAAVALLWLASPVVGAAPAEVRDPAGDAAVVTEAAAPAGGGGTQVQSPVAAIAAGALQSVDSARSVTQYALQMLGVGYRFGGNDPAVGFDCSGLVQYVYKQATGVALPRSARSMSKVGEKISLAELVPGDIVFFNTRRFKFSHVGVYIGNNQFVHAPVRGRPVEVSMLDSQYWQKHFNGARRIVDSVPGFIEDLVLDPVGTLSREEAPPAEHE
ncbi:MAG TPA: C40 family peptidase [Steroidobacteraceae bacterium]|nr:C40 family peptidase [Steroidobacteraceae bacterium]